MELSSYETVFDLSEDILILADSDLTIQRMNSMGSDLFKEDVSPGKQIKCHQLLNLPEEPFRDYPGEKSGRRIVVKGRTFFFTCRTLPAGNNQLLITLRDVSAQINDAEMAAILKENNELLTEHQLLFDEMVCGFALHEMVYDNAGRAVDYRFLNVNAAFENFTGLKRENVIGKCVRDVYPGISDKWIERYASVAESGNTIRFNEFFQEINKHFEIKAYAPRKGCFAVIFNDFSAYKQIEEQLVKEKTLTDTLMTTFPDNIYFKDIEGRYVLVSNSLVKYLGVKTPGEVIGKSDTDFFAPIVAAKIREQEKRIMNKQKPVLDRVERLILKECDRLDWFISTKMPLIDRQGKVSGTFGISRYYTVEYMLRQQLLENEAMLNLVFENTPEVMLLLDEHAAIVKINKQGLLNNMASEEEALGRQPGDLLRCIEAIRQPNGCGAGEYCNECGLRESIQRSFKEQKSINGAEIQIKREVDGEVVIHTIRLHTSFISLKNNKLLLITIDNISDIIQVQQELALQNEEHIKLNMTLEDNLVQLHTMNEELLVAKVKAEESDRLKTAFLANMSHEIRTPMNGIIGFCELISKPEIEAEKREVYSNIINRSCNNLLEVVNDILDVSKLETGELKISKAPLIISQLLTKLFAEFKDRVAEKELNLLLEPNEHLSENLVFADGYRLIQVMGYLLKNALKFTHLGYIRMGCRIADSELQFFVEDTGIGIEKEMHQVIFDRFRQLETDITRKYGGTGLGLTIASQLVKLMGGRIWVDSVPGEGSVFSFSIPYQAVLPEGISANDNPGEFQHVMEKTILVVEDEEVNFFFLSELLLNMNYQVLYARDGAEGVEMAKDNPDIDLILMDIKMPVMNGVDALGHIRKINPGVPVVAQTAYAMTNEKEMILKAGFDDYIVKPIRPELLKQVLARFFNRLPVT